MRTRSIAAAALFVALAWSAVCPAAPTLSGLIITDSPASGLTWDTVPNGNVTAFVKDGPTFLNPTDAGISIDLANDGSYSFDLRLNKGSAREMSNFRFLLFFNGAPDNGPSAIDVIAPRDTTGATPPFAGDSTELLGSKLFTLTSVRVSSFNSVNEVGEFTAVPDGQIDYVGGFSFTMSTIPEPSSLALAALAALGLLRRAART